jgi:hypothetical protein
MSANITNVVLRNDRFENWRGWDIKQSALSALLEDGHDEVLWIDSDIIIARDFHHIFGGLSPEPILVTEEALYGGPGGHDSGYLDPNGLRARSWGYEIGRIFPFTANTAVMRVTTEHIALLREWGRLLHTDIYQNAQGLEINSRPLHLVSDQDALTALLTSQQFSRVPVKFLRRGKEIIQYLGPSGYTVRERIGNMMGGLPPFIHSQGEHKPWLIFTQSKQTGGLRHQFYTLQADLSPYTLIAMAYRDLLTENCTWLKPHSVAASFLRAVGLRYPPVVGFPIALLADAWRMGKRIKSTISIT